MISLGSDVAIFILLIYKIYERNTKNWIIQKFGWDAVFLWEEKIIILL